MSRKIGVNVVSLVPWSLGQHGLNRARELAEWAGFCGLQLLPLRGWDEYAMAMMPEKEVISFELAWNSGSLFGVVQRQLLRIAGESQPLFHDWLLFGNRRTVKERTKLIFEYFADNALFIARKVEKNGILEMHPELNLPINNYIHHQFGLVWDTSHILRPGRHGEKPLTTNWRKLFHTVQSNIKLIHVKSTADPEMLKVLNQETTCPIILEDDPPLCTSRKKTLEWLKGRRDFLDKYFN